MSDNYTSESAGVASTNRRLDKVEHDVQVLNTAVATMTTEVRNLYTIQNEASQKLDKLLDQGGVQSATKGMIPVAYITWGVSAFIATIAVGLTALTIASNSIKEDIQAGNALNEKEFERLDTLATANKERNEQLHVVLNKELSYNTAISDLKLANLKLLIEKEKELLQLDITAEKQASSAHAARLEAIIKHIESNPGQTVLTP